jgi:hypothetical protein
MKKFTNKFKEEFKKQIRLAIAAAVGFLIAFSWRDTVLAVAQKYVQAITTIEGMIQLKLVSSFVITILGVLIILLSSKAIK